MASSERLGLKPSFRDFNGVRGTLIGVVCVLTASIFPSFQAHADIYKWRDEHGKVHYSDQQPGEDLGQREISGDLPHVHEMDSTPLSPLSTKPAQKYPNGAPSRQKRQNQSYPANKTARARQPKKIQERCEKYQQQLDRIQRQLRAGYTVSQGNRLRERRRDLTEKQYRQCRG